MDIKAISNLLLDVFYALVGFMMISVAVKTFLDKNHKARFGTTLFWSLLGIIFVAGTYIPSVVTGVIILVLGVLTATKQVKMGTSKPLDGEFAENQSVKLKNLIFIPSITIAVVALLVAQFTKLGGTVSIGIAAVSAILLTIIITKANPKYIIEDGNRMLEAVGPVSILPQLLAALGAVFTAAGVGDVIASLISGFIPQGSLIAGITAYCVGMALFTMVMGNSFAAFAVITAGVGVPFVFAQGANPAIAGALALTAGYCGTLLTPMAANFNIIPSALLETKDKNIVIKYQAPIALLLLIVHIILMYVLAF